MTGTGLVVLFLTYLLLLFGIASVVERGSGKWNRRFRNRYNYALSLTVYCTAWTYFGSVGRAAESGLSFLPIYLGPLMLAPLWPALIRKMVNICKEERITSIPDLLSSRFGKSRSLGMLAAIFFIIGVVPYISLQLKAISAIFELFTATNHRSVNLPFYQDSALLLTLVLALFTTVYGVRRLDANDRHAGVIAAISFEAVFKLFAFLAVGILICIYFFGSGNTFSFTDALRHPELAGLWRFGDMGLGAGDWFMLCLISMCAVVLLPRQFHVAVVENRHVEDIDQAAWVFPLYLLLINIFVIPIAAAGVLYFGTSQANESDIFVITLPLALGQDWLAIVAALGGFAAATGMVIMSTISLSLMIGNNIILPYLFSFDQAAGRHETDLSKPLLNIRRLLVIVVLLLAYGYYRWVAARYSLVATGLISFAAVAQFAPSVLAALYWKAATRRGVLAGLLAGFAVWAYTLAMPTLAVALPGLRSIIDQGPWGLAFLRPESLFGLDSLSPIAHGAYWSLLANLMGVLLGSLSQQPDALQIRQANFFVDNEKMRGQRTTYETRRREARVLELERLLGRFLGLSRARTVLRQQMGDTAFTARNEQTLAPPQLITTVEQQLAGAVGTASAQILLKGISKEDPIELEEVITILRQTQEAIRYGKQLEQQREKLQRVTTQLRAANHQLRELDTLKADFISTVTHELRTPITSITSLAQILLQHETLEEEQRITFLRIIVSESQRLGRLVSQVLDIEKLENKQRFGEGIVLDVVTLVRQAASSLIPLAQEKSIALELVFDDQARWVLAPPDRLTQVVVNLVGNAIKFSPPTDGRINIKVWSDEASGFVCLRVRDNGTGIPANKRELVFDRFTQITDDREGKPRGSGLGLYITRTIVERCGGNIAVESDYSAGAGFLVRLPLRKPPEGKPTANNLALPITQNKKE